MVVNNIPKWLFDHIWSCYDFGLWSFDLKSKQFMFVPKCIWLVNLVKFSQAVCKILC